MYPDIDSVTYMYVGIRGGGGGDSRMLVVGSSHDPNNINHVEHMLNRIANMIMCQYISSYIDKKIDTQQEADVQLEFILD